MLFLGDIQALQFHMAIPFSEKYSYGGSCCKYDIANNQSKEEEKPDQIF
jgi:hypothetical protein